MTNYIIGAVKDELTGSFLQPTFAESEDVLKRIFKHQINSIGLWKDNASDFSLYKLGNYDEESGKIVSHIEKLVSGQTVKED